MRTRHWELYAEADDIRHGIESGGHVNAEEDVDSEGNVESSAPGDFTDQPYQLPEEVYDHLLEDPENDPKNAAEPIDYTDQLYQLLEEEYDHLLELPRDDIGDGLSEDFPAALIWKKSQKTKSGSDNESASDDGNNSDQSADSGSEDDEDDGDEEEHSDEDSVNHKRHSRDEDNNGTTNYSNKRAKGPA